MITIGGNAIRRLDRDDPALSVDGLEDFFPATGPVGSSPTVRTLHDLFPAGLFSTSAAARSIDDGIQESALDADDLGDCFPPRHIAATPSVSGGDFDSLVDDEPMIESEIQRAARAFQRFAEQFHAFAAGCQRGIVDPAG